MILDGNKITTGGTFELPVLRGHRYVFAVSGDFNNGLLTIYWIDAAGTEVSFAVDSFSAAGTFEFAAPTDRVSLVVTDTETPDLLVSLAPIPLSHDSVTNPNVVAAIGDGPAAVVTALSTITDTDATTINLVAADSGKILRCTSSSSVTINMPSTDPDGNFSVAVIRAGTGSVTFSANGKTLNSYGSALAIAGQHAWASLIRVAADTYNLSGTLA